MASGLQKSVSDAGAGAGVGYMFGGPYGAAMGAGVGGILGLFSGGDDAPQAPLFSDVNLATDNPALYSQLQKEQSVVDQIQQLYTQRSQGMTLAEQQQYGQTMAQTGAALAHSGMAGTSQGIAQMNNASQNYQNNIAQRIMEQQKALAGELTGAQNQLTTATQGALQQDYNAKLIPYQQQIGEMGNQNQMYNGFLQGGMNLLGQGMNQNKLNALILNGSGGMLPAGYGFGSGGQGITYNGGANPFGGAAVPLGTSYGSMPLPSMMPVQQPYGYGFNPAVQ